MAEIAADLEGYVETAAAASAGMVAGPAAAASVEMVAGLADVAGEVAAAAEFGGALAAMVFALSVSRAAVAEV